MSAEEQIKAVTVRGLTTEWKPWSAPQRETWAEHACRLWRDEPAWMTRLAHIMTSTDRWYLGPVIVDDGFVQDGHHRLVVALGLGWHDRTVPMREALSKR